MISREEKSYILDHAYVPEHSVGLMTTISGGEPYLIEDCFCCRKRDWVIIVGYPLGGGFFLSEFRSSVRKIIARFRPRYVSLIAPEPFQLEGHPCRERESDRYYLLCPDEGVQEARMKRLTRKAESALSVEFASEMGGVHKELSAEFVERVRPSHRVRELLFSVHRYAESSKECLVLNAWKAPDRLAAFYVVDMAARRFSSYVIGCHSKKVYVPGASDLLLSHLIRITREQGKEYIHLGLGVNDGVRRFKEKWGGKPNLGYEMCEVSLRGPGIWEALMFRGRMKP